MPLRRCTNLFRDSAGDDFAVSLRGCNTTHPVRDGVLPVATEADMASTTPATAPLPDRANEQRAADRELFALLEAGSFKEGPYLDLLRDHLWTYGWKVLRGEGRCRARNTSPAPGGTSSGVRGLTASRAQAHEGHHGARRETAPARPSGAQPGGLGGQPVDGSVGSSQAQHEAPLGPGLAEVRHIHPGRLWPVAVAARRSGHVYGSRTSWSPRAAPDARAPPAGRSPRGAPARRSPACGHRAGPGLCGDTGESPQRGGAGCCRCPAAPTRACGRPVRTRARQSEGGAVRPSCTGP